MTAHSKAYSVEMTRAFLPFTPWVVKTPRHWTRRGELAAAFRAASSQQALTNIVIEHAHALADKTNLHEHSVLTFYKIPTKFDTRVLARETENIERQNLKMPDASQLTYILGLEFFLVLCGALIRHNMIM